MKEMKKKLKSESGVSILFALLLMLVVAMVSVVMVNASLTAVKRTSAKKNNQQVSISLDSAALLLRDRMTSDDIGYVLVPNGTGPDPQYILAENQANLNPTFKTEIQTISAVYAKVAGTDNVMPECNGKFDIVTTVDGKSDKVNVNYLATKTDDGRNCRAVFTLSEDESQVVVTFNLSLVRSDQVKNVKWSYGGAGLEAGQ